MIAFHDGVGVGGREEGREGRGGGQNTACAVWTSFSVISIASSNLPICNPSSVLQITARRDTETALWLPSWHKARGGEGGGTWLLLASPVAGWKVSKEGMLEVRPRVSMPLTEDACPPMLDGEPPCELSPSESAGKTLIPETLPRGI